MFWIFLTKFLKVYKMETLKKKKTNKQTNKPNKKGYKRSI